MNDRVHKNDVIVIGGGFVGLACAYELALQGISVTVLEKDDDIGGLASSFRVNGQRLENFYHHWFNNDQSLLQLVRELGCEENLLYRPTKTTVYLKNKFFRLSTPLDILRFTPLSFLGRIRLGLLVLQARRIKDYKQIEGITAREWLLKLCGPEVYKVVWEPLLRGKFGAVADEISAVWFWNKLVLRGGSRSKAGGEELVYYRGGFGALAQEIANAIKSAGGMVETGVNVEALLVEDGCVKGVETSQGRINAWAVIATCDLPAIADLAAPHVTDTYVEQLRKIRYLANVSLVLELSHNLSDIYWLNVNDPDFPFVGVIEHTNFEPAQTYGGTHIVYLSKYLPESAELYQMNREQLFKYSLPYIKQMFPEFDRSSVLHYHVFKAPYAQPVVECHYSQLIPENETPIKGFYIASMAQIYPEDRGTNYAIRQGRSIGRLVAK